MTVAGEGRRRWGWGYARFWDDGLREEKEALSGPGEGRGWTGGVGLGRGT